VLKNLGFPLETVEPKNIKGRSIFVCTLIYSTTSPDLIELLLQVGFLACALAQEVQLRPPDMGVAFDHNLVNARRVKQESALDANAIAGRAPNRKIGVVATFAQADYRPFKLLDALAFAFFNAHVNTNAITRKQVRDVWILGGVEVLVEVNHRHLSLLSFLPPLGAKQDYNMSLKV